MPERMELRLEGEPGQIGAKALHEALGDTLRLLDGAASSLDADPPRWRISTLGMSSVYAGVETAQGFGVVGLVSDGLRRLREIAAAPPNWSADMLRSVRRLGSRPAHDGVQGVTLTDLVNGESHSIDGVVADHAQRALEVSGVSWGSVRGKVGRWNGDRRLVGLYAPGEPPVEARYPAELEDRVVTQALRQNVEVWGEVERNSAGQVVGARIVDFTVVEPQTGLVSIRDVAGIWSGDAAFPQTVREWIENNRGED